MYWLQCELRRFAVPTKIHMKLSYCKQNTTSTPPFVWEKRYLSLFFTQLNSLKCVPLWIETCSCFYGNHQGPTSIPSPQTTHPLSSQTVAQLFLHQGLQLWHLESTQTANGTVPSLKTYKAWWRDKKTTIIPWLRPALLKALFPAKNVLLGGNLRFPWNMELKHQTLQQLDWWQ